MSKLIDDKLNEGRQYRSIDLRKMEVAADDGAMIVEGYATTFNEPYELYRDSGYVVYEQIDPAAFEDTDMTDVIMQYDHEGRVFARQSNGTLSLAVDEHGLRIRADIGGTELGRQLYDEIKGGYTNKMSFGFRVDKDRREISEDKNAGTVTVLRTITGISKLYDVSAVSLPANDATIISARSVGEGVIADAKRELLAVERRKRQMQRIKIMTEV